MQHHKLSLHVYSAVEPKTMRARTRGRDLKINSTMKWGTSYLDLVVVTLYVYSEYVTY